MIIYTAVDHNNEVVATLNDKGELDTDSDEFISLFNTAENLLYEPHVNSSLFVRACEVLNYKCIYLVNDPVVNKIF